jgi:hypothetical protein
MKLNKLIRISDAIEIIENQIGCASSEIIWGLVGIAFTADEARELLEYIGNEDEV